MNARLQTEVLARLGANPQTEFRLETEGVLRYVWESRFGDILIEVKDGQAYVNGQAVEPADPADPGAATP